ncbi:hypothetical protein CVO77_14965 [Sphingopyxis lindanitolerans]|uniref:Uncharacterized protein n=1 Tax=Sphingopyxis lindanitolerans TaxID=2054227 RepID=A0A2S8B259_9SPHN|nr:hypothetical protein CVO77_14965 [Sphingopyxis lindanitolerans]
MPSKVADDIAICRTLAGGIRRREGSADLKHLAIEIGGLIACRRATLRFPKKYWADGWATIQPAFVCFFA